MSKNKKKVVETPKAVETQDETNAEVVESEQTVQQASATTEKKKQEDKKGKNNQKNTKKKEKGKLKQKAKETLSEFKKVTWPTFADVCKKTGVVLVVVLIFAVIIFGMDRGLGELMKLLTKRG